MGQAKQRGTFEERKAEAIEAGRIPEVRRNQQRVARILRRGELYRLKEALFKQIFNR